MEKTIIVYVCDSEFVWFEGDEYFAGDNKFKVRNDGQYWFFAVENVCEVFNTKKDVKAAFADDQIQSGQNFQIDLVRKYIDTLYCILQVYFMDLTIDFCRKVYVITHWGGGSPEQIDKREERIAFVVSNLNNERFKEFQLWSASETYRPFLFSDNFNTVVARRKAESGCSIEGERHIIRAKLPDAEECARILERLKNKDYGCGAVNWNECKQKALYDDIMRHLNH